MVVIAALSDLPDPAVVEVAAAALLEGLIIGLATDTVYGLAARAADGAAVERIYVAKNRPEHLALPVLVSDPDQADSVAHIGDLAAALIDGFWPGGLTIVCPARPGGSGQPATVGLRWPRHALAVALCRAVGPLATTSANRHGQPPATTAATVSEVFGDQIALVLDGGACLGAPSTVVDATGSELVLLREGVIPWSELRTIRV